jgi:hypothetical protein
VIFAARSSDTIAFDESIARSLHATAIWAPASGLLVSASVTMPSSTPVPTGKATPGHASERNVLPDGTARSTRAGRSGTTSTTGELPPYWSESSSGLTKRIA